MLGLLIASWFIDGVEEWDHSPHTLRGVFIRPVGNYCQGCKILHFLNFRVVFITCLESKGEQKKVFSSADLVILVENTFGTAKVNPTRVRNIIISVNG